MRITLPYMLHVTTPYLISQFIGNINNFNVIFLLTGGNPGTLDYEFAGKTDLLITWLYKLTFERQNYKLAAVISILTFVVVAVTSLIVYNRSGSVKNEEEFM
jgi:arabinogalactan oligomer/maltooligosaccharide transport system permease protein